MRTLKNWKKPFQKIEIGKGECLEKGTEIAILSFGTIGNKIVEIFNELPEKKFSHYAMKFVKPLDEAMLFDIFNTYKSIVTIEDGTIIGGFGGAVLEFAAKNNLNSKEIKLLGVPDSFIEHGKVYELFNEIGLSNEELITFLLNL